MSLRLNANFAVAGHNVVPAWSKYHLTPVNTTPQSIAQYL